MSATSNNGNGKRLPNELIADLVNAMPAGIIYEENGGFLFYRMDPLSAFIQPRAKKFASKARGQLDGFKRQLNGLTAKRTQLDEARKTLDEMQLWVANDPNMVAEFDRQRVAWNQQKKELAEENEEFSRRLAANRAVWARTFEFAMELAAGGDKDKLKQQQKEKEASAALIWK